MPSGADGRLQEFLEHAAGRSLVLAHLERGAELTENLRFADHRAVETARHPVQVVDDVTVESHYRARKFRIRVEQLEDSLVGAVAADVDDFDAKAGGQHECIDPGFSDSCECRFEAGSVQRQGGAL